MQDTEFTVEEGRLYMLQTRNAKRPAQAAVRFAVDAVERGAARRARRRSRRSTPDALDALLHPTFDPDADYDVLARGVDASPGAAKGEIVFTADDAVAAAEEGRDVVLVRPFTEADDVAGFYAAQGHPHQRGRQGQPRGARGARHGPAVRVRRVASSRSTSSAREVRVNGTVLQEGDLIAIDGTTGVVTTDDVPLVEPEVDQNFERVLGWADEMRRLGVRANADTPEDARKAREFGAEGIGLCRTEHMFMAADRQPKMRAMIMAETEEERRAALDELLPLQQEDFEGLFEEMAGLPVTIRLLDPPLHEFLPDVEEVAQEVERARIEAATTSRSSSRRSSAVHRSPRPTRCSARAACRLGDPPPGDLRDAGAGDRARRARGAGAHRRRAAARDHDPAGRLREGARAHARAGRARGRGARAARTST